MLAVLGPSRILGLVGLAPGELKDQCSGFLVETGSTVVELARGDSLIKNEPRHGGCATVSPA